MAKGNFLTSIVSGKLGNMVGYKNTNSNDREKQAWRSYNSKIRNPKSVAQARQRMIMRNLTGTYSQLKPILSRSWEGVQYGAKSYARFLQANMVGGGRGPWVTKDNTNLIPATYQISEGSLESVSILLIGQAANRNHNVSSISFEGDVAVNQNFGNFCAALIEANPELQNGDQLTFIDISQDSNIRFRYLYRSFILDTTSALTIGQAISSDLHLNKLVGSGMERLAFYIGESTGDFQTEGGAVIVSRKQEDGSYLRSTSVMFVNFNNLEIAEWYSDVYFDIALASYMDANASLNGDWPTQATRSTGTELTVKAVTLTYNDSTAEAFPLCFRDGGLTYILYRVSGDKQQLLGGRATPLRVTFGATNTITDTSMLPAGTLTMEYNSSMGTLY